MNQSQDNARRRETVAYRELVQRFRRGPARGRAIGEVAGGSRSRVFVGEVSRRPLPHSCLRRDVKGLQLAQTPSPHRCSAVVAVPGTVRSRCFRPYGHQLTIIQDPRKSSSSSSWCYRQYSSSPHRRSNAKRYYSIGGW